MCDVCGCCHITAIVNHQRRENPENDPFGVDLESTVPTVAWNQLVLHNYWYVALRF
jgi:hypothetical protein